MRAGTERGCAARVQPDQCPVAVRKLREDALVTVWDEGPGGNVLAVGAGVAWVCAGETRLAKGLAVALGEAARESDDAVVELGDKPLGWDGTLGCPAVVVRILPAPALGLARGMGLGCRSMRKDAWQ